MTNEEKQLLLVDLCARLPYGVIGLYTWKCKESYNRELTGNLYDELCSSWNSTEDSQFLPYLRPMSSMTEDEKNYMEELSDFKCTPDKASQKIDFYNSHHVDYRGLIPMGLAIEAPEGMYN